MKRLAAAAVAALLCVPCAAFAGTDAATAEDLLRDSGLWSELGDVSSQVAASVDEVWERAGEELPASERSRLDRIIDSAYASDRLRAIAREVVETKLAERHLPAYEEWFDGPVGKEIARLENDSPSDRDGIRRLVVQGVALLEQMPASRRDLLDRIVEVSRAVEATSRTTINSTIAVLRAVARAHPEVPFPSEQELRDEFESAKPKIEKSMRTEYLEICASVYATVPDAKLEQYEAFLGSEAGRHLTDLLIEAVDAAMTDAASKLGRDLVPADESGTKA